MSSKQKRELTRVVLVLALHLYPLQLCLSESAGGRWEQIHGGRRADEKTHHSANVRRTSRSGPQGLRSKPAALPGGTPPPFILQKVDERGRNVASNNLSWTAGHISPGPKASASDHEEGYQADFTGFHGVQGKVLGPAFDSSPHFPEWQAMRPFVQCDENVMTFTASGQGLTHLLVDREAASPISLFQLPPYCGYSVRTSWSDLEMMAPYDACYITQENDSYVLPMLWWDTPLKLSCPVQPSTPAPSPSLPSVFCSPYGMAVQKHGQEQEIPMLGVKVNGGWRPFVSEECAYLVHSRPDELTFFISYKASCITSGDGLSLHLVYNDQEYILSCPVSPQLHFITDPVSPVPTTHPAPPPQPPTEEQIPQLQHYSYYPYPGLHYAQLPQVYPPGPELTQPPKTPESTGKPPSPPSQPPVVVQATYAPTLIPAQISQSHQLPFLPLDPTQYSSGLYYPHMPFYYPAVTQAPTSAATKTTTTTVPPGTHPPGPPAYPYYPHYYPQIPYHPAPTAAPATLPLTSPSPPPPPPPTSPPKTPVDPQPPFPHPYYPYYYPFYPLFYHPPYHLSLPQYPEIQTPTTMTKPPPTTATITPTTATTSATTTAKTLTPNATNTTPSTTTQPATQMPHLQCLMGRMVVFLPFAHQDSIQVKDQRKTWLPLSTVSPLCGYMLQMAESSGVILHSPLPACHSLSRTPTTISLPLMFWDLSMGQYRTLEPQCPYESTPVTSAPVTPPAATTPPSTTPSPVQKPKVSCSSHHMTVKLPSGPVSGILLKDMKGNQMSLQDAPEHCGYSASKGKDGRIQLSLRLQSQCHMSVQGNVYIISIVYMTMNERREAQVSCPAVVPGPGKECSLPSDQRLPCGSAFVSQPQCLSMGCCFSKNSEACYYPMDECTVDHHFVFSVPASITEPPLSLAQLVAGSNSTCRPQRVTSEYALFKIPMDGCGARRVVVGQMVIYMVEVVNKVQGISVNHGTITRDSPVRFLVECRFQPGSVLTVSYLVKTPTLGPGVQTQEMHGVQLRIAKDPEYSSFYPQYHQPMQMLLGKPLYLEVRLLNAPDPGVVLLVHFCVAYPRSGTSVWVLLYNGCPNPLDPAPHQAVLSAPQPPSPRGQTRRFTISTFQFLPDGEFKDPNEEIYFMCSTEICSPRDGPCVEGCFGQ
ncbi:uncharacterized protein LOC133954223 [Platichthys flesus]|uniref:uncharacterized protein LOC133954223 n=1 Tax=Platichthys flesus TaxID=8260 RepID=UPI002DB7C56C|nr:uncharacterized protein LOC133954223 [Platichthys flesus]